MKVQNNKEITDLFYDENDNLIYQQLTISGENNSHLYKDKSWLVISNLDRDKITIFKYQPDSNDVTKKLIFEK